MKLWGLSLYILLCLCFFIPSTAYAYLDPGTGNALVYVVISLFGAVIYSLKGLFYKIIGKKEETQADGNANGSGNEIVIFSEGKAYWNTFKPVVKSLIDRKAHFSYYTMDVDDPCLTIDNPYITNRYIGNGSMAFSKIGNLKANVVLSTTPNIGSEGYPIPRSAKIKKLAHVFHAFDDLTCYHRGSLDHYDSVLLVGPFEIPIIQKLESIRNTPAKELYPAGLPYLDELASRKEQACQEVAEKKNGKPVVLVAPSWGIKGCLTQYGQHFIELLAKAGFTVIIRPHPQSLKVEKTLLDAIQNSLKPYNNVSWDFEVDGTASMMAADILISDTSSVRVDFLFIYQKPIITLEMPFGDMQDFEFADLKESWKEQALATMGYTVRRDEIENIVSIVENELKEKTTDRILAFRDENIYNWRNSGEVIAEYLIQNGKEVTIRTEQGENGLGEQA